MHLILIVVFIIIVLTVLNGLAKKGISGRTVSQKSVPRSLRNFARNAFSADVDREAWMNAAGELGVSFVRPTVTDALPSIHGDIGKFEIEVRLNEDPPQTIYQVLFPEDFGIGFLAMKDPDATVISRFFSGRKHFETLMNIFPDRLKNAAVSAYDEKELAQFLTPERRDALKRCFELYPSVSIDDNSITVTYNGIDNDHAKICARIYTALEFAKIFGVAVPAVRQTPAPAPEMPDITPPKETLKPEIRNEEPEPLKSEPELEQGGPPQESAAGNVSDLLKQEILLPELFGATFAGAKEKELFDSLKGKEVHWTGTVKSVYEFGSDFVFGSGGGAKTTLEVLELTGAYSMKTKIKAVVCFPKDQTAELRGMTGKEIRFRGTLLKFEAFAKEIYMTQGILE